MRLTQLSHLNHPTSSHLVRNITVGKATAFLGWPEQAKRNLLRPGTDVTDCPLEVAACFVFGLKCRLDTDWTSNTLADVPLARA